MLHNIPFHLIKSLYNVYAAKFARICGVVGFVKYHIIISSLGNLDFNVMPEKFDLLVISLLFPGHLEIYV